jgi:centractin
MRIMPGGALETEHSLSGPSSIFVGRKLDDHRGSFILEYPMDKGYVVDGGWDAMESLWEVSYGHFKVPVLEVIHTNGNFA